MKRVHQIFVVFLALLLAAPARSEQLKLDSCATRLGMRLPTSEFFQFWFEPDPEFEDSLMIAAKPLFPLESIPGFETGLLAEFIYFLPERAKKLGISRRPDGTFVYPIYLGINRRIQRWRDSGEPNAPGVLFELDRSNGEPDIEKFLEDWSRGVTYISLDGKFCSPKNHSIASKNLSLHCHDVLVHLPAYAIIPAEILRINQYLTQVTLAIYRADVVQQNPLVRKAVYHALVEMAVGIDHLPVEFIRNLLTGYQAMLPKNGLGKRSVGFTKFLHLAFRSSSLRDTLFGRLKFESHYLLENEGKGIPAVDFIDSQLQLIQEPQITDARLLELLLAIESETQRRSP